MRLYKRPGSPYWWASIQGKRRSTKRTSKKEATEVAMAWTKADLDREQLGRVPSISLGSALCRHLAETAARDRRNLLSRSQKLLAGRSVEGYGVTIETNPLYQDRFGLDPSLPLERVTSGVAAELYSRRIAEGNKPATAYQELAILRRVVQLGGHTWGVPVAPTFRLPKIKFTPKTRALTDQEIAALLLELDPARYPLDADRRVDQRDLVILILSTGARYSEIAARPWSAVSLPECGTMQLNRTKTGTAEWITLPAAARQVLQRRYADRKPGDLFIFPARDSGRKPRGHATGGIMKAMERAGINTPEKVEALGKATVHSLRDTYATRLLARGVDIVAIQKMLGHSTVKQTEKYARLVASDASTMVADKVDAIIAGE